MSQHSSYKSQVGYVLSLSIVIISRSFRIAFYFIGAFLAEFGSLGVVASLPDATKQTVYSTLAIGIILLIGSLIYFFRKRFKTRSLPWLQYFWWILGVTIGCISAIALEFAMVPNLNGKPQSIPSAIFAGTIFLYGIAFIVIAHLQPTLRYQVNDSVRTILNAIPGKQMVESDLITLIQNEYKCSEMAIYKYIEGLDDVEQMVIPETATRLYRIKGIQEAIAFPQMYSISTYDLRQNVARAMQFLNEENVDLGLFILSKTFEDSLKIYLIEANKKGMLSIIPGNKSPEKLSLPEMISCVKNNSIINNDAVLALLRQVRNNRAHGTMPSLTERKLLMKSVPYIAGLYIDYIKLIDDLKHSLSVIG